jgi:adenylylsulfate kinase-like enzyme
MAKGPFSRKKIVFANKTDSDLRKNFVKCYIWSTGLCGAGTWTLQKVHRKNLGNLEMWCWRRMEKIY